MEAVYMAALGGTVVLCGILKCSSQSVQPPARRAGSAEKSGSAEVAKPQIQPKKIELNEKEAMIKQGLQTGKHAYPTLEDIPSDWDDDPKNGKSKKAKKSKMAKTAKTEDGTKTKEGGSKMKEPSEVKDSKDVERKSSSKEPIEPESPDKQ